MIELNNEELNCEQGLARTATLLAVEQEDDEITLILQDYIRRKSNRNTPERLPIIIDERSTIDEIELDETEKDGEIMIDTNLQNVKNLNRVITKGQPPNQRYLSSVEKEQNARGKPKTRGSYKCRVCNGIGHNAAFHKNVSNK
ncbi:unnamed protein product [Rhizophagus irregularis]|uniref:Uncharacterized protein n=1 Tax=Rhizophagus irregularis TaxID=588596 RepID=A0A915YMF4_9GLOM|nr:unnamed protein product [Rhizophagus irregularis]